MLDSSCHVLGWGQKYGASLSYRSNGAEARRVLRHVANVAGVLLAVLLGSGAFAQPWESAMVYDVRFVVDQSGPYAPASNATTVGITMYARVGIMPNPGDPSGNNFGISRVGGSGQLITFTDPLSAALGLNQGTVAQGLTATNPSNGAGFAQDNRVFFDTDGHPLTGHFAPFRGAFSSPAGSAYMGSNADQYNGVVLNPPTGSPYIGSIVGSRQFNYGFDGTGAWGNAGPATSSDPLLLVGDLVPVYRVFYTPRPGPARTIHVDVTNLSGRCIWHVNGIFGTATPAKLIPDQSFTFPVAGCGEPTISAPLGSTVCPGQLIALQATAPDAMSYQWLKDLSDIPGATDSVLEIPNASTTDAGSYQVRVTFACGERTSEPLDISIAACQPAPFLYDSQAQFSGVQGQGGWEYGFYDGDVGVAFTPADFEPLPLFAPLPPPFGDNVTPIWNRHPLNYWTLVDRSLMHPNGTAAGRTSEVNWAVRRWTSPISGPVRVQMDVSDTQDTCGDGVVAWLFKNDAGWMVNSVPPTESRTQLGFDCVAAGDRFSLALSPGAAGNEQCDTFNARLRIGSPFIDDPADVAVCVGGAATLGVRVADSAVLQYRWRRNGVPISIDANPSAATAFLHIPAVTSEHVGTYDCEATLSCGTVTSGAATVSVCGPDYTCDGFLTFEDFDAFVGAFESGNVRGDFNADGFITFEDFDAFVTAFEAGC